MIRTLGEGRILDGWWLFGEQEVEWSPEAERKWDGNPKPSCTRTASCNRNARRFLPESEARQIGDRTCAQTRLETVNPKQELGPWPHLDGQIIAGVLQFGCRCSSWVLWMPPGGAQVLQIGAIGLISRADPCPWLAASCRAAAVRSIPRLERRAPRLEEGGASTPCRWPRTFQLNRKSLTLTNFFLSVLNRKNMFNGAKFA